MIRFIVRTVLIAGMVSWLGIAGPGTQPAAQHGSGERAISVCSTGPGTSALDWFCGSTDAPPARSL